MTYTKSISNQKYFLNDKNIAQTLEYGDILINAIPSLDLLSSVNDRLSAADKYLSDYILSVETSAYCISSTTDSRLVALSNLLSSYSDKLCSDLSNLIDNNRAADKKEVSSVLSSYSNTRINELSDVVAKNFLSNTIDLIGTLSVKDNLFVKDDAVFDRRVFINGNLIQGQSSAVKSVIRGIALGISSTVEHDDSFVWNGSDRTVEYKSHGPDGTFNINPEQGTRGFYIGEQSLSDIIKNDVALTASDLTSEMKAVSAALSNQVGIDRTNDKAELSNVLSSYSNSLCSVLSVQIDKNRTADKDIIIKELSDYANSLCASISSTVLSKKFSMIDKVGFKYNDLTHIITLSVADLLGEEKVFSIDSSDFIKNRIVDHVDVVTPTQDPKLSETVLRIWWTPDEGSTVGIYTDIPISLLAKVYTAGDGIDITDKLVISANATIARQNELNDTRATLNVLSSIRVSEAELHIARMQGYINTISADGEYPNRGTIWQLSDAISLNSTNIANLSSEVKYISSDLTTDIDSISTIACRADAFDNMLCTVTAGTALGVIPTLSSKVDDISYKIRMNANYVGKIIFNKYHPDFEAPGSGIAVPLSTIFSDIVKPTDSKIKNGSIYEVILTENKHIDESYGYDNPLYAADSYYDCSDGFRMAHKDFLYVQNVDDPSTEFVKVCDLSPRNVRRLAGASYYEAYQLCSIVNANYAWLSGNTSTAVYKDHITRVGNEPATVFRTGHALSGDNSFTGKMFVNKLSAQHIYCDFDKIQPYILPNYISDIVDPLDSDPFISELAYRTYEIIHYGELTGEPYDSYDPNSTTGQKIAEVSKALSSKIAGVESEQPKTFTEILDVLQEGIKKIPASKSAAVYTLQSRLTDLLNKDAFILNEMQRISADFDTRIKAHESTIADLQLKLAEITAKLDGKTIIIG